MNLERRQRWLLPFCLMEILGHGSSGLTGLSAMSAGGRHLEGRMAELKLYRLGPDREGVRFIYAATPIAPLGRKVLRGPDQTIVGLFEKLEPGARREFLAAAPGKY